MRLTVSAIVFSLAAFVAALVWFMPMSAALRLSGLSGQGVSWSQALGRAVDGDIVGAAWQGWRIGQVSVRADLLRGLQAGPPLVADWSGPSSDGFARIGLGPGGAAFSGLEARLRLPARRIAGFGLEVPASSLRLQDGRFILANGACQSGEAAAASDAARKLGQAAGLGWPALTGTLRCEAGAWSLHLTGTSEAGAVFTLDAARRGPTRIRIEQLDPATAQALAFAGLETASGQVSIEIPYTE
ncbi:MAG: type II secretion system protein N [Acidobacteria bacterium]|jgi:hypothetical protein|nr:type II secretion system protein N [Acidobacteriota bacterium]